LVKVSDICITSKDLDIFKKFIPSDEDVVYATYGLIAHMVGKIVYRWKTPFIFTNKHVVFFQISHQNKAEGFFQIPLYKTHVFNNHKHVYISYLDFRPQHNDKSGETKSEFKERWLEFQKKILPYIIESQKEHLRYIKAHKEDLDFYNKMDLKNMPWFGKEEKVEKNIRKMLPKFESKLSKLNQ
jgi:hypothetical protein